MRKTRFCYQLFPSMCNGLLKLFWNHFGLVYVPASHIRLKDTPASQIRLWRSQAKKSIVERKNEANLSPFSFPKTKDHPSVICDKPYLTVKLHWWHDYYCLKKYCLKHFLSPLSDESKPNLTVSTFQLRSESRRKLVLLITNTKISGFFMWRCR